MEGFNIDDVEFVLDTRPGGQRGSSARNKFVLVKSAGCLDFYRNWKYERPKAIMEIGILEGGSLVLFDKLFAPDVLVGLDVRRTPVEPLEDYRQDRSYIRTYYGRSQDGFGTMQAARTNFPDGIDLIVDDASHKYPQTKATFGMLFPFLRVGGKYVIEDWAWSHRPGAQKPDAIWAKDESLTNLVIQLVIMAGAYGVVESLHVQKDLICLVKGRGKLPEDPFDLSSLTRGRSLPSL